MHRLAAPSTWSLFVPKLVTCLREGYSGASLRADLAAGLTVAIVALPLSMALAIASGTTPERGLITAIIAGFLISALGGSRFQIGGPTGAFVVIVFDVIARHGYDGLLIATLMAGVMLVLFGLFQLGTYIKYIPYPVVTGFTSGIALLIFSSQMKDFLGLPLHEVPAEFLPKWGAILQSLPTAHLWTAGVGLGTLALIVLIKRFKPGYPVFLIGIGAASVLVWALHLPVETIGSRFGEIPRGLPTPSLPDVSLAKITELFPSAFTIALLAGIESLLSAVVADGMTGRRHRSNCELVGQGVANILSATMGGFCATGAIARTATNIRSGGRTPVAGMAHALFLLGFMVVAAPLASYLPLASLGAVLVIVAWNMSEYRHFLHLMKAPRGDRLLLLATFLLTVLVDLTVAIQVGVVLAAITFTHRMAKAVEAESGIQLIDRDRDDWADGTRVAYVPDHPPRDVAFYRINGPFFFGVADKLNEVLDTIGKPPKVLAVDMTNVPLIDSTAVHALEELFAKCRKVGTRVDLIGTRDRPRAVLDRMEAVDGVHVRYVAAAPA